MSNKLTAKKIGDFHAAIGRFVLAWADIEVGLDLLVIILHRHAGRSNQTLPHALAAKIKFIRSKARTLPRLGAHQSVIYRLIDEIEGFSDTRHDYVHGAAVSHALERSKLSVTMGRLLQPQKRARRKTITVTASQINQTSDRLHIIGGQLLDVAEAINRLDRIN